MESSSLSGSSKRAKAPGSIGQAAHCLVDGCCADLSECREYHRRHKVCEVHSKTPKVTIGGREQRFCQQCSRFHSLVEFDEGKRSCRKRLDGHNRRRRKPQPESLPRKSGLDFSTQQAIAGTRLVSFSAPQILPSSVVGYSWSNNQQQQQQQQLSYMDAAAAAHSSSSSSSYKGVVNQVQLVQGSSDGGASNSICDEPFVDPNGGGTTSSQSLNHFDGALSLLSSATPPLVDYHLPHQTAASTLHFPEMFHHAPEGSSAPGCGSHQTLSFMWE